MKGFGGNLKSTYLCTVFKGEVAERFNAPVLKTDEGNTSGGSNPSLSASFFNQITFKYSGHSAVRLACLLWEQKVESSNLSAPTSFKILYTNPLQPSSIKYFSKAKNNCKKI